MVTLENLDLTIALLRRKKQPCTPAGLIRWIPKALALAYQPAVQTDLGAAVRQALDWEHGHPDDHSEYWVGRLVRSQGTGREVALTEWKESGRG